MGQLIGVSIGGPYVELIIVVIVFVVALAFRLYMAKSGGMRAKCKKCGNVFDSSRSFSVFHIGSLKALKCPACGKTSLMKTYVKEPITWPAEDTRQEPQTQPQMTQEELEQKRIEESKYEKA
jgi:ribosomal protein S27AE